MHNHKQPTLVAVWDKLTPNQRDHALCMSFMRGAALCPALAAMQGMLYCSLLYFDLAEGGKLPCPAMLFALTVAAMQGKPSCPALPCPVPASALPSALPQHDCEVCYIDAAVAEMLAEAICMRIFTSFMSFCRKCYAASQFCAFLLVPTEHICM